jgi:hypothetical protein
MLVTLCTFCFNLETDERMQNVLSECLEALSELNLLLTISWLGGSLQFHNSSKICETALWDSEKFYLKPKMYHLLLLISATVYGNPPTWF